MTRAAPKRGGAPKWPPNCIQKSSKNSIDFRWQFCHQIGSKMGCNFRPKINAKINQFFDAKMIAKGIQRWRQNGPQKPAKNRWKFTAVPGGSQGSQILAKPTENHSFSRFRGLAFESLLEGILVPQIARKIHANPI